MEINQISGIDRSDINMISDKKPVKIDQVDNGLKKSVENGDIVSLDQNSLNGNLSVYLGRNIERISNIQQLQKSISAQISTISKLEYVVKNEISADDADVKITSLINNYNSTAKLVYSNLNEFFIESIHYFLKLYIEIFYLLDTFPIKYINLKI